MRLILMAVAGLTLAAAPAYADHDHGKKKKDEVEASHDHSTHDHGEKKPDMAPNEMVPGEIGEQMKVKADDHADHGTMSHGKDDAHAGHSMDSKTMPADGAVLHHTPKQVGVNFGHAMKVEAITISTLTGEMIELDVSQVGTTDHVMVDAPELQADDYIVDWRARGDDGHIMSGSFSFTVE